MGIVNKVSNLASDLSETVETWLPTGSSNGQASSSSAELYAIDSVLATESPVYHVRVDRDGWRVECVANGQLHWFDNKRDAIDAGRDMAREASGKLVIHDLEGRPTRISHYDTI